MPRGFAYLMAVAALAPRAASHDDVACFAALDIAPPTPHIPAPPDAPLVFTTLANDLPEHALLLFARDAPSAPWRGAAPRFLVPPACARLVPSLAGTHWAARAVRGAAVEEACGGAPGAPPRLATAIEGVDGVELSARAAAWVAAAAGRVRVDGSDCAPAPPAPGGAAPAYLTFSADARDARGARRATLRLVRGAPPPPRGEHPATSAGAGAVVSAPLSALLTPLRVVANYTAKLACPACNYAEAPASAAAAAAAADALARLAAARGAPGARLPLEPCAACGGTGRVAHAGARGRVARASEAACAVCGGVGAVPAAGAHCSVCGGARFVDDDGRQHATTVAAGAPSDAVLPAASADEQFLTLTLNVTAGAAQPGLAPWSRARDGGARDAAAGAEPPAGTGAAAARAVGALLGAVGLPAPDGALGGAGAHIVAVATLPLRAAAASGLALALGAALPAPEAWALRVPPPLLPGDEIVVFGRGLPVHDPPGCAWAVADAALATVGAAAAFFEAACPARAPAWARAFADVEAACAAARPNATDAEAEEEDENFAPVARAWPLGVTLNNGGARVRIYCAPPLPPSRIHYYPHGAAIVRVAIDASEAGAFVGGAGGAPLTDDDVATLVRALHAAAPGVA
jgi:hypothetical protein